MSKEESAQSMRAGLPQHAQDIYRFAFRHAMAQYGQREDIAARIAWAAVERVYMLNDHGTWIARP